jgi:hypothetical protein
MAGTEIPKVIWFMWLQGLDNAPDIVGKCISSWERYNPGWKIIFLDEHNLEEYINLREIIGENGEYISRQALADVARINLLAKYGGVWVDATCFCCVPLDEWLTEFAKAGFFAFSRPRKDKLISNWFLASTENNYLTSKFCAEANSYWSRNSFSNQGDKRMANLQGILRRILNRNPSLTRLWFSFAVRRMLKVYPYFWSHYLFAEVIRRDELCRRRWNETKDYCADIPHKLQTSGLLEPVPEELRRDIDSRKDPLYKLTRKYDENRYTEGCTLDYLFHSHNLA